MNKSNHSNDTDDDILRDIEMKQPELYEGGSMPTNAMQQNGYSHVNPARQPPPIKMSKVYCKAIYQVLLHLIILYCMVGVTYVIFFDSNSNKQNVTVITGEPTTLNPSLNPSFSPTVSVTGPPITTTTLQPTIDYSVYAIGDYKISAQNASHTNWLLCDGSFVGSTDYPKLFEVIGYSFGAFSGYPSLFALPNAVDRVVGMNGDSNKMGSMTGYEQIALSAAHMPSHWHYVARLGSGDGYYDAVSRPYLGTQWGVGNFDYQLRAHESVPNSFKTGSVGSGTALNVMQPTVFVGNLFIYSV